MYKLLLLLLFTVLCSHGYSQEYNETRKLDSLRIDRMKKEVAGLKSHNRIDALINLSIAYNYMVPMGGFIRRDDSVKKYSQLALNEATVAGYKKGRAMGMIFTKAETDAATSDNLKEAIRIGEQANDADVLGWAYYRLGDVEYRITKNQKIWTDNMIKSAQQFRKAGDIRMEAEIVSFLCLVHVIDLYDNSNGFQYCERSMELANLLKKTKSGMHEYIYQSSIGNMVNLYNEVGDYKTSLAYLNIGRQYAQERGIEFQLDDQFGTVYSLMGQHDSAIYYLKRFQQIAPKNPIGADMVLGEGYIRAKQFDKALPLFKDATSLIRKKKNIAHMWLSTSLINTGKTYVGLGQFDSALIYSTEGYRLAQTVNNNKLIMEGVENLANVYEKLGRTDSALHYLKKYMDLKESLQSKQFLWRLNNQLYHAQRAVEDEKKTSQLQLQLKQEAQKKNSLILVLSALMLTGFLVFRNFRLKRRNETLKRKQLEQALHMQQLELEKGKAEFRKRYADLEMLTLRTQMKPHFIFNSLGSINAYILEHDVEKASDYLSRFSKLMRMVLNTHEPLIPLEDELKMLELYLDMERLRLDERFDYTIIFKNAVDAGDIRVPPMLLQPFCENAIWHGLMPKQGKGILQLEIGTAEGGILNCIITDNGIGRKRALELKSSTKRNASKGLQITRERLSLLNQERNLNADFEIEDLYDTLGEPSGTRVHLKIAYCELLQQIA